MAGGIAQRFAPPARGKSAPPHYRTRTWRPRVGEWTAGRFFHGLIAGPFVQVDRVAGEESAQVFGLHAGFASQPTEGSGRNRSGAPVGAVAHPAPDAHHFSQELRRALRDRPVGANTLDSSAGDRVAHDERLLAADRHTFERPFHRPDRLGGSRHQSIPVPLDPRRDRRARPPPPGQSAPDSWRRRSRSIFIIARNASITGSGAAVAHSFSRAGSTCQETPKRSWTQPHMSPRPPSDRRSQ